MSSDTLRARRPARLQLIAARCIFAVAGTAVIAACGSVAAPASGGASASGGTSSPAAAKVSLNLVVLNGPSTTPKRWTLRCDPAGGTHPHAATACRALLALKDPFALPKAHHMCPMIVASDKRVVFTGTYFGAKVHRTIIDGGCDLARWSELGQVLH
jgi:hypothetical protein